jgi:hypothetical protein
MTDRTTLLALADRCEQAAGPDRELDFAIAAGVGWPDSPNLHQNARRYTESLDAAVTLYLVLPRVIPSCPRKASAAALRARAAAHE